MGFFTRSKVTRIKVIHSTSLRMKDWCSSKELVTYAQKLFATPEFQTMLGVLRNETPSNMSLSGGSHDDHIAHAYRGEGYNSALFNLEALARMEEHAEALEATFEPESPIKSVN